MNFTSESSPTPTADTALCMGPLIAQNLAEELAQEAVAEPNAAETMPAVVADTATKNFYEFNLQELEELLTGLGKEKFRAKQVFKWVYEQRVENF